MASAKAIRDALVTRLDTIDGLRALPRMPDSITPPAAFVQLVAVPFDSSMGRDSDDLEFKVQVLTSRASDRGEDALYDYIDGSGAGAVKAAIEGDPTLGGLVDFLTVVEARDIGAITGRDGVEYYTVSFIVRIGA